MDRAYLLGSPAVDLVVWPVEGFVSEDGIFFVEERGVLKDGIVKGYGGRGRGGSVGRTGDCIGCRNVGGQGGLNGAGHGVGSWVALEAGVKYRIYMEGNGVDELGSWSKSGRGQGC